MDEIVKLREQFQRTVCLEVMFLKDCQTPSIADIDSNLSSSLARSITNALGYPVSTNEIKPQTAGRNFETAVRDYVQSAMKVLAHLRPADWIYSVHSNISEFFQYRHLATLKELVEKNKDVYTALGDYVVKPDVLVARRPVTDETINQYNEVVNQKDIAYLTPLRQTNHQIPTPILHASISCKLTLRSDRSQNARTEGLNLIRNRKGHTPHIVVVTAEPMPTRITSLALGTGDIDCVYHFGLNELMKAAKDSKNEAVQDSLETMVEGGRLRDIADLPFDLVV
ncbi:MAG: restriction endonuclease [Gemmatimonadetes bacterium]|nr:restriction endonuclease [Gemmatimonadota bacterium]